MAEMIIQIWNMYQNGFIRQETALQAIEDIIRDKDAKTLAQVIWYVAFDIKG